MALLITVEPLTIQRNIQIKVRQVEVTTATRVHLLIKEIDEIMRTVDVHMVETIRVLSQETREGNNLSNLTFWIVVFAITITK